VAPDRCSSGADRAIETETAALACAQILASDQRALRAARPAVRVSVVTDAALSFGVGVPSSAPYLARARELGLSTARRSSGGTGVVHAPGDLVWSIVLPRDDPRVGRRFVRAYGRLGRGVVRCLGACGIEAGWTAPAGLSESCCVLGSRGEVLAVGDRALGGAAQHLSATALLHQGMVPREVDRRLAARIFDLAPATADRLIGLRDLGIDAPPTKLARRLADAIALDLGFDGSNPIRA
jgi:lipoate-protein ligase A